VRLASVVITNYNYAQFLGRAIESALGQSHPHVQVIVVDDGSTDASREVIAQYGTSITSVLKENGGQGSAFNSGIAAARGRVIYFLDADDEYTPDVIAQTIDLFDGRVARAHWPFQRIDGEGRRLGNPVSIATLASGDLRQEAMRRGPGTHGFAPTSAMATDSLVLSRLPPLPAKAFRTGADTYVAELTTFVGPIAVAPDALTLYRQHGDNDSDRGTFADRLNRWGAWYDACAELAERYLVSQGTIVDRREWERHGWAPRLRRAVSTIEATVPAEARYLLIDDDGWSLSSDPATRAIPCPEMGGIFWGQPADDIQLIDEFAAKWRAGVRWVAVGWTSFWWRETYAQAFAWLASHSTVVESDDVVIFRMGEDLDLAKAA